MWRTGYDEEWKRRKEYLIRSLFEDVPQLSPVAEAEESFDGSSSRCDVGKPSDVLPSTVESRPYSPLPPLIIEKEPNRHDEPNEYYRQLELKMLTLYRRLFIEGRSASISPLEFDRVSKSVDIQDQNLEMEIATTALQCTNQETNSLDLECNINEGFALQDEESNTDSSLTHIVSYQRHFSDSDTYIVQRLSDPISEEIENFSNPIEPLIDDEINTASGIDGNTEDLEEEKESRSSLGIHEDDQQTLCSSEFSRKLNSSDTSEQEDNITTTQNGIPEKYNTSSCTESSTEYYQQITFEAQVHREDIRENVEKLSQVYGETERNDLGRISRGNSLESRDENQVPESDIERTIERCASEENEVVEMMRTPRLNTSAESLQNEFNKGDSSHISMERRKTRRRSLEVYSPSEILGDMSNFMDIERCSDDFSQILQCSTPKRNRKRRQNEESALNNKMNHVTRSSNKKRKCEDAAVQVSHRPSWSSLQHNFFAGSPKIFRLCSCKNHICYC